VLSQTTYLALPHQELEQRLAVLVDELVTAVTSRPFSDAGGSAVGTRLVELRCTDPASLRRTLDVLGKGLLALPELDGVDGVARRVVAVFGALAAAYTDTMRLFTIEQQENLNHALLNVKQNLLTSEARFDEVAASSASGIAITDLDGRFVRTNVALARIVGQSPNELTGLSLFDVLRLEHVDLLRDLYRELLAGPADRLRQVGRLLGNDDGAARVSLTVSLLRDTSGVPSQFVTVVEDATELALLQDELLRQSLHDVLTGLPNRQYFLSRLERILHAAGPTVPITLYHLDLDAFSLVVGGLGLRIGQRLLTSVAECLMTVVEGERAMVGRFESDEFVILVENSPNTPDVATMIDNINEALSEPIYIEGIGVAVSASIGVLHLPPANLSPLEMLAAVEMTLRRAQRNGHRQWELFDVAKDTRDRDRSRLAISMPGAWETGEVRAVYQPWFRLSDGRIVGIQAKLRWHHPELGVVDNARCVELAERTGLIVPLGAWLLKSACEQFTRWSWLTDDVTLNLDLSPSQAADHNLIGTILRTLAETRLDAARLCLTVPVSALRGENEAMANLRMLADIGMTTVLGDIGAAPADLALLTELPAHVVRIASWHTPAATPVLSAMVTAAHEAGAEVAVDGVDTAQQAHWWRDAGADTAQGPHFAPPTPADDIPSLFP
jgi:diguanylate cyclase (GGDEF)-like protein/PAS domain S-box-containing protein